MRFRGSAVHLRKERYRLHLTVDRPTSLVVGRADHLLGPGKPLRRLVEGDNASSAFVIACYSDPGLQVCREATTRPITQ